MNSFSNVLLMLVPERMLGSVLLFMIVAGGLAIIIGFRKAGKALVIAAISIPLVAVLVEALMNSIFDSLPDGLVLPVSVALVVLIYLWIGWMLVKWVFGQRAVDHAKGELLADAMRGLFRLTFSKAGLLVAAVCFAALYLRPGA